MKLFKVLVAALVMVGMAMPVIAEDRLKLSGEMRVRGWYKDLDNADNNTSTWADQRLRLGGTIAVAEGVSVTFRTDITESSWGNTGSELSADGSKITGPVQGNGYGSGRSGAAQQWDRAHLDLKSGNFHVRAGQQYVGYGLGYTVDTQDNGVAADYKWNDAFSSHAFVMVDDNNENTATAYKTSNPNNNADAIIYGLKGSYKADTFALDFFHAAEKYGNGDAPYPNLVGIDGTFNLGVVKLMGEFDYFWGDMNDAANRDVIGTQGFLDASMAATDAIRVGLQGYYAQGASNDEVQWEYLGNGFNGWDPIFDVGTNLSNEETDDLFRPYDFTNDDAGCMAGRLYASFKLNDKTNLGASIAYMEPEKSSATTINSAVPMTVGVTYEVMSNTSLQAQYAYVDLDDDADNSASYYSLAGVGIFVSF
jgi:hypothetical protein